MHLSNKKFVISCAVTARIVLFYPFKEIFDSVIYRARLLIYLQ